MDNLKQANLNLHSSSTYNGYSGSSGYVGSSGFRGSNGCEMTQSPYSVTIEEGATVITVPPSDKEVKIKFRTSSMGPR